MPYLFGGVHILLGPTVAAVYDLVEPDFVAAGAPDEAVRHHGMPPQGQRIGLFAHAAVGGDPVADGDLDGQVGAPAALVFQIALPRGGAIFGTVDLEERDRRRRVAVAVHPFQRQSRNRCDGSEDVGTGVGEQVTHLAAVRHAGTERVFPAQAVLVLQQTGQFAEERHVVDGHVGLERVPDVPAGFAAAVLHALRVADGEAVAVGRFVHAVAVEVEIASVAVQHEDERRVVGHSFGQIEAVGAF